MYDTQRIGYLREREPAPFIVKLVSKIKREKFMRRAKELKMNADRFGGDARKK